MTDDWILPPYTIISGLDPGIGIEFDDAAINHCRKTKSPWLSNCQICLARVRCDELVREEAARELGTEPPEEVEG